MPRYKDPSTISATRQGYGEFSEQPHLLAHWQVALLGRGRRSKLWGDPAADDDVAAIGGGQQQPRHDACHIELADGNAGGQAIKDENDTGRNERGKASAGTDAAKCDPLVVAAAQHRRQGNHAHGDDLRTDHAHHRCHQRAGKDHRNRQAAGYGAEPNVHGAEDGVRNAGALQDACHENKQRHGHEDVVAHQREDAADD